MKKNKIAAMLLSTVVAFSSIVPFAVVAHAEGVAASGVWYESMYMEWTGDANKTFTAFYKDNSQENSNYEAVDAELVREVNPGEYRVDVLGLKGDTSYSIMVKDGDTVVGEYTGKPLAHDRSGFAFDDEVDAPGAYKMDGTLDDGTLVLYLTDENKKNLYDGKSLVQVIGNANTLNNGNPIDIRVLGRIDLPLTNCFQLNVSNVTCGLTIEGVGADAGFVDWGMNINYDEDVEVRNLVIRDSGEDAMGMYRTKKLWIHNNTVFAGYYKDDDSDERDKLHGDGSCDLRECDKVTVSYNHYNHTDKTCLLGSSPKRVEPTGGITFHHNFFDQTGQRTPRVRWHDVHLYNNYYYGTEVYGVAATNRGNIFAENNTFEDAASPFLISSQSEYTSKFSTNDGGAIKTFNNKYINTRESVEGLDYFVAPYREYKMTAEDFTAIKGGWTYDNFDQNGYIGAMNYKLDPVENVKDIVLKTAGAQKEDSIVDDNGVYPPTPKGNMVAKYYYDSAESGSTGVSYGGENGEGTYFTGEGTCKEGAAEVYYIADKHDYTGCFSTDNAITFTTNGPAEFKIVAGAATEVPERTEVINEANPDAVYHGTFQTGYKGGTALSTIVLTEAGTYTFKPTAAMDIYYMEVTEYDK